MVVYLSSVLMITYYFGIDNRTMDIRKCDHREINVGFTLIIGESCLDRTRVLYVPFIRKTEEEVKRASLFLSKNILMGYMK